MLGNIAVGCVLLVLTTSIHCFGMVLSIRLFKKEHWFNSLRFGRALAVSSLVLVMFMAAVVEATLWATTYVLLGAMDSMTDAVYYSTVTFTTLGYGDLVLSGHWRLLGAFEAACGTIMFGWTAAIIVAAVQRTYFVHQDQQQNGDDKRN